MPRPKPRYLGFAMRLWGDRGIDDIVVKGTEVAASASGKASGFLVLSLCADTARSMRWRGVAVERQRSQQMPRSAVQNR